MSENLYIELKNDYNQYFSCIISKTNSIEEEFEKVLSVRKGYGFSIRYSHNTIDLVDYFVQETRASYEIVKMEETSMQTSYQLTKKDMDS